MTTTELIDLYKRFEENTELGDAVGNLLVGCSILHGIGSDHEVALVMLAVEKLVKDYMEYARDRQVDWDEYRYINPELYSHCLGGAQKLSREDFERR